MVALMHGLGDAFLKAFFMLFEQQLLFRYSFIKRNLFFNLLCELPYFEFPVVPLALFDVEYCFFFNLESIKILVIFPSCGVWTISLHHCFTPSLTFC